MWGNNVQVIVFVPQCIISLIKGGGREGPRFKWVSLHSDSKI